MTFNSEMKKYWNDQKTKLKNKFPELSEKDLAFDFGKKNEMFTKLQVKLGKSQEQLIQLINTL
jgi:hypothetical protein